MHPAEAADSHIETLQYYLEQIVRLLNDYSDNALEGLFTEKGKYKIHSAWFSMVYSVFKSMITDGILLDEELIRDYRAFAEFDPHTPTSPRRSNGQREHEYPLWFAGTKQDIKDADSLLKRARDYLQRELNM